MCVHVNSICHKLDLYIMNSPKLLILALLLTVFISCGTVFAQYPVTISGELKSIVLGIERVKQYPEVPSVTLSQSSLNVLYVKQVKITERVEVPPVVMTTSPLLVMYIEFSEVKQIPEVPSITFSQSCLSVIYIRPVPREKLPDLTITSFTVTPEMPTTKDTITIKFRVCNTGNATSPKFGPNAWTVYVDGETPTTLPKSRWLPELRPRQCADIEVSIGSLPKGTHTIAVVVDPDNKVRELNEENNLLQKIVKVVEVPTARCVVHIEDVTVPVNNVAEVKIWLINCSLAASINIKLKYDKAIINVVDIAPGKFKDLVGGIFGKNIDNIGGIIALSIAGTRACSRDKVLVATMKIRGVKEGVTRFEKVEATVSDVQGNILDVVVTGGLVKVSKFIECDLNKNGRLDIGDAVLCLRATIGEYMLDVPCDLNRNGRHCDIGDCVLILRKLVEG